MEHIIRRYGLEQGALEVQYIEEHFSEFRHPKTAEDIVSRLRGRECLILMSMAAASENDNDLLPVAFKVGHELKALETRPDLAELAGQLGACVRFDGRKVFYSWIGGTRKDWRGHGHYRALTEEQEQWAHDHRYHEIVVKTKNRFYPMRTTLDRLRYDVIKLQPNADDPAESKLYLSKRIGSDAVRNHRTVRTVEETV